jgi:hypothetical protein
MDEEEMRQPLAGEVSLWFVLAGWLLIQTS